MYTQEVTYITLTCDKVKSVRTYQCITGAYLLLEYRKAAVALERLQSLLKSYLRQEKYSEVAGHIGKPAMLEDAPRNRLQVVLADVGDYRGDCVDLANALAARIRNS